MRGMGIHLEGRLDVVMRDEEIMYPGTFEYAERVARRDDINFHWLIANQAIVNVFNRAEPYWWVMDEGLDPEQWVRQPPDLDCVEHIEGKTIGHINSTARFPCAEGKAVYYVMGLRASESARRTMAVFSAGGAFCYPWKDPETGMTAIWGNPIYDWKDEDIWLAINRFKWDYNKAYDVMNKMGVPKKHLRIAPPTLNQASVEHLGVAARAWPHWFDRVATRLKGVRTAAQYGGRACKPHRRYGESWEQCFMRECINEAPADWIKERSIQAMDRTLKRHNRHATSRLPDSKKCKECGEIGNWRQLATFMYGGDPFSLKVGFLKNMEPEFFRKGAGFWGGKPTW